MVFERVVTEQTHRANVAAGGHRCGNMVRLADQPFAGQRIHVGRFGGLKRRSPAERFLPFVGGAIGDNKCVFHGVSLRRAEPAAQIWRTPAQHASDGRSEYNLNMSTSWPEPRSAYLHVPFCAHRCGYCDFTLVARRDDLIDAYLDALAIDLAHLGEPREVDTLFFGGGTPTHLAGRPIGTFDEAGTAVVPSGRRSRNLCRSQSGRVGRRENCRPGRSRRQSRQPGRAVVRPDDSQAARARPSSAGNRLRGRTAAVQRSRTSAST